ncbi:MAG: type IV pili methyl-accepting chemotaxis transducer N-terminal domain-containing protein [Litoreibacter sp.]
MLKRKLEPIKTSTANIHRASVKTLCSVAALSAMLATSVLPAWSQSIGSDAYVGGKARVNKSASLRSLSEQLASASCRLSADIETDVAKDHLASTRSQFQTVLSGLEDGNPALGIPTKEDRSQTLNALKDVKETFASLDSAADNLLNGTASAEDAALIASTRSELFNRTFILASEISGQYSDPFELTQSDAITLDFAGRQRALVHRITRILCELDTGTGTPDTQGELTETVTTIENTLIALRDGFPAAAINPPPTDAVKNSIIAAYEHWTEEREFIDEILDGKIPTVAEVVEAASFAQSFNIEMNNAITLYLIGTPGQEGLYRLPLEQFAHDELMGWLDNEDMLAAIRAQNIAHTDLNEEQIIALDKDWRAQAGEGGGPLISRLLGHPVSTWLLDKQNATAGFVTEVFVMDNKGLNVAQSAETSDYWQGDEAKWQETYLATPDALHISDIEFDDSTGYYQAQASLPIVDPETKEIIGAITFGINVQSLI